MNIKYFQTSFLFLLLPLSAKANDLFDSVVQGVLKKETVEHSHVPVSRLYSTQNSDVKFLSGPEEVFSQASLYASTAKYEINIATYVWKRLKKDKDIDSAKVLLAGVGKALEKKIQSETAGAIKLRILINQIQLGQSGPQVIAEIVSSVNKYLSPFVSQPNKIQVEIATYPHMALGNLHSKYVIVDGKKLVVTGANIESHFNFDGNPWFDVGISLQGEAAKTALYDFDTLWNHGAKTQPAEAARWSCSFSEAFGKLHCKQFPGLQNSVNSIGTRTYMRISGERKTGNTPVLSLPQSCDTRDSLSLDKEKINSPQNKAWLTAFRKAKYSINLITPNIDSHHFREELVKAVQRGVEVKLITGRGFNDSSISILGQTNSEVIRELKQRLSGNRLFESKWYVAPGKERPVLGNRAGASHTKMMLVDDEVLIVGSGNQTRYSWYHSCEYNLAIKKVSAVSKAVELFEEVWERSDNTDYSFP